MPFPARVTPPRSWRKPAALTSVYRLTWVFDSFGGSGVAQGAVDRRAHERAEIPRGPFVRTGQQRADRALARGNPQLDQGGQLALGVVGAPRAQGRPQSAGTALHGEAAAPPERP